MATETRLERHAAPARWPAALGIRPLDTAEAYAALEAFVDIYGREPLRLLLHAAVPETLRADLLHLIRVNFMPGPGDPALEADVLLAPIVTALGGGCYRIDAQVRWHALALLRSLYRHEPRARHERVAELLWRHLDDLARQGRLESNPALAEYVEIQRWVALANLDPTAATHAFAEALHAQEGAGTAARVRLGGLAAAMELPLSGEPELVSYARGLDALVHGDHEAARSLLGRLGDEPRQYGDVTLRPASEWVEQLGETPATVVHDAKGGLESDVAALKGSAESLRPPKVLSCLLIHGREPERDGPAAKRVVDELVLPALREMGAVTLTKDEGSGDDWKPLVQALITLDRVVIDLSSAGPTLHLLVGVAWALRRDGIVLIAESHYHATGMFAGLPVVTYDTSSLHSAGDDARGTRWEVARLAQNIEAALRDQGASPVYAAWPELLQPRLLEAGYSNRAMRPERLERCLVLGAMEDAERGRALPFEELKRAFDSQGIPVSRFDEAALARGLTRPVLGELLHADLLLADWGGASPDELAAVGVRLALRPYGTVLTAADSLARRGGLMKELRAFLQPAVAGNVQGFVRQTLGPAMKGKPLMSPVYDALAALEPAVIPAAAAAEPPTPVPATSRTAGFKVYVSHARPYLDVTTRFAATLRRVLEARTGIEPEVFVDRSALDGIKGALARAAEDLIDRCDAMVVMAGPPTSDSRIARAEQLRALRSGRRIIPVLVDPGPLPAHLQALQIANLAPDGLPQPLARLRGRALDEAMQRTAERIADALLATPAPADDDLRELTVSRTGGALQYEWPGTGGLEAIFVDAPLIAELLRPVLESRKVDPGAVRALAQRLLPKEVLAWPPNVRIRLRFKNWEAATLPWELLLAASALEAGREAPLPSVLRLAGRLREIGTERHALLIGDPLTEGTLSQAQRPPPLAHAEAEIQAATQALGRAGFSALMMSQSSASDVLARLYERHWRVLVVAGHATNNDSLADGRRGTGFLLSGGVVLGAEELLRTRELPELMVLDGDLIGRIGDAASGRVDAHAIVPRLLAAGADTGARADERMANPSRVKTKAQARAKPAAGASAGPGAQAATDACVVVAPAWPVADEIASLFTRDLVAALCEGAPLEAAAGRARSAAYKARPEDPSWAAYQVWGPPAYRLAHPDEGKVEAAR